MGSGRSGAPAAGDLPREILDDLETSQVSIFAVQAQANELKSRMQMTDVVNRRKIRHAHMVNINRQIMLEGMRADFLKVDRISTKVVDMVRRAKQVRAKTSAGTDLTADLNPDYRWLKTSGIISPDKWGNLPGGEVFTTPGEVNGTFVIDGVVGDWLCAKFGSLRENPLTIQVKGNRLTEAHSANRELEDDFWRYTHTDENSDRVGEFAIGTNIELKDVIGQILQDEKYPGIHIAFGNPYGAHTGAEWYSSTHIDVVGQEFRYLGGWRADHAERPVSAGSVVTCGRGRLARGFRLFGFCYRGRVARNHMCNHTGSEWSLWLLSRKVMIPALRQQFNANFTPEKYQRLLKVMEERCGTPVKFRVCETPCLLPKPLLDQMSEYGKELIQQLNSIEYRKASSAAIPDEFKVPRETTRPLFMQVDFGLVRDKSGKLQPKLVELQGFPSLYAYQAMLSQSYGEVFDLDPNLQYLLGGSDWESYKKLLRRAIVGDHDPKHVILMEIDPLHQKTLPDFLLDRKTAGNKDRRDHRRQEGGQVPVLRERRKAHPDPAHLQPRHRGRNGAQRSQDLLSSLPMIWKSSGPDIPTGFFG